LIGGKIMKKSSRLDWTIYKHAGWWFAQNMEDGSLLTAKTKPMLMSKINEFDKENQ